MVGSIARDDSVRLTRPVLLSNSSHVQDPWRIRESGIRVALYPDLRESASAMVCEMDCYDCDYLQLNSIHHRNDIPMPTSAIGVEQEVAWYMYQQQSLLVFPRRGTHILGPGHILNAYTVGLETPDATPEKDWLGLLVHSRFLVRLYQERLPRIKLMVWQRLHSQYHEDDCT